MLTFSIVIVSYNTKDFLRQCLRSIKENIDDKLQYEVIVVDNASSDGSMQMLQKEFPEVILIANSENLGFSKANNIGVKKATGKYILFLNPDIVVHAETIETITRFLEKHDEVGAATCKVLLKDGSLDDASHRGFPTPWNAFTHFSGLAKLFPRSKLFAGYSLGWEDLSKTHEIDALAGAFMMVKREAGEEVGWWDEDFFWYGEDLDFCFRLKQKKWKIYFVPGVTVLHYKGVSGGIKKHSQHLSTASSETRRRATVARFEAMKIFYKKHYSQKYPRFITTLIRFGINTKLWFNLRKL